MTSTGIMGTIIMTTIIMITSIMITIIITTIMRIRMITMGTRTITAIRMIIPMRMTTAGTPSGRERRAVISGAGSHSIAPARAPDQGRASVVAVTVSSSGGNPSSFAGLVLYIRSSSRWDTPWARSPRAVSTRQSVG
jgi:hypothetical protein